MLLFFGSGREGLMLGLLRVLHSFTGSDGEQPLSGVVIDAQGNLFGTTFGDNQNNYGTVYELTPTGVLKTLYSFTGGVDGGQPQSRVVLDADGNLYGTTANGGAYNDGAVFKITP